MSVRREVVDLQKRSVLRITGPASVRVVDGKVMVSGVEVEEGSFVIQAGRGVSIYTLDSNARLELSLGAGSSYEVIRDESMLDLAVKWLRVIDEIRDAGARRILVLAPMESGKSTFSLWASNRLGVCYSSLDPGQNELGTPCFLSAAKPGFALTTLDLKPAWAWLVGSNAPEHTPWFSISAAVKLSKFLSKRCNGFIGDTDGFVEAAGVMHKEALIEAMELDAVVVLKRGPWMKLAQIAKAHGLTVYTVDAVPEKLVRARSRAERRMYRERMYRRMFENAPKVELRISDVPLLNSEILDAPQIPVAAEPLYVDYKGVVKRMPRGWERGLIASLVIKDGYEVPALIESFNPMFYSVTLRVAWEPEGRIVGVKLGFIRLVDWKEERLRHTLHPVVR